MEVRPGYKQTEVGVIPDDWDCEQIARLEGQRLVKLGRGQVISRLDIARTPGDFPIYSSSVHNKGEFGRYGHFMFDEELITWSIDGGGHFFWRSKHKFSVTNVCGFMRVDTARISYAFLAAVLQLLHSRKSFDYQSKAHPSVIRKEYVLPLPPLPEQRAIAAALSDVDALLGGLDRLIAKKRDLKQAAMQQLLTGQTRLPGFRVEWEPMKFSELLKYERPDQYIVRSTEYEEEGSTPVLTANKSFVLGYTSETFGVCDSLPVIIFDDFTTDSKYVEFPFKVKSSAIKILKARSPEANLKFIAERMRLLRFLVGEHKRHYISEYQHVELPTPVPDEQSAIATVLSDMDAELAALEARRDKTRDLKQAMMQELLTGKTRLVRPEAARA